MTLRDEFILHADLAKAANEALNNVDRLRLGGYFREAFEICAAMTRPGPWQCPKAGLSYGKAVGMIPMLAWLNGAICPALDGQPRRTPAELGRRARAEQRDSFGHLVMADRLQVGPAGSGWTREGLERLPASIQSGMPSQAFGAFIHDLDWVLKDRVRRLLQLNPPELVPEFVQALTPFRSSAVIDVSVDANAFDHADLMDILHRCLVVIGFGGHVGGRCLMLSIALDLAVGNHAAASARLEQWSEWLVGDYPIDYPLRLWEPYVAILRSGLLARSLGLDDEGVSTYVERFRARSPATVVPAASASDFGWRSSLEELRDRVRMKLSNPRWAENAVGMLEHHVPVSSSLIESARRHDAMLPGLNEDEISSLEGRLGVRLPPSYRSFLTTSNGLFAGGWLSILPANDVDWFRNLDP